MLGKCLADSCDSFSSSQLQHCRGSLVAGEQLNSKWPVAILAGLVLLAVALVAAVVTANPGIFRKEFKAQFLLVSVVQLDVSDCMFMLQF